MANESTAWSRLLEAQEHRAKKDWATPKDIIEYIVRHAKPSEVASYPSFSIRDLAECKVYNLSSNYALLKAMCIHAGLNANNINEHIDSLKTLNQYSEPTTLRLYVDFSAKDKPLNQDVLARHIPQLSNLENWSRIEDYGRIYDRPELMDTVFDYYVAKNVEAVRKIPDLRDRYYTSGTNNLSIELARLFDQEKHSKKLENVAIAHHDLYGLAALVVQGRTSVEQWLDTAVHVLSQYTSDRHSSRNDPISDTIALLPSILKQSNSNTDLAVLFTHVLPKIEPILDEKNQDYLSGVRGWLSTIAPLLTNGTLYENHPYTKRVEGISSEFWKVMNEKPAYAEYLRSHNDLEPIKALLKGSQTYQEMGVLLAMNSCFYQDTIKASSLYWSQYTTEELQPFKYVSLTDRIPALAVDGVDFNASRYRSSSAYSNIVHNAGAILPLLHPNDICVVAPSFIESKAINEKTLRSEWAKYDAAYSKTIPRDFNTSRPAYLLYAIARQDPREALSAIQLLGNTDAASRMGIYTSWLKQHLPGVVQAAAPSMEGLFA